MTKAQRQERLLPNGIPRWIRCYDNGGETIDRYTVVFTGHFAGRPPYYSYYLAMNDNPYHPQGFGQHGECVGIVDRPAYSHLGKPIIFQDLPEMCKLLVLTDYKQIWGLE